MKRSKFSLSYHKLLSARMGQLIPVGLTEVLPGDTVQHATSALLRTQPLLAPVMHPVRVQFHHWFVPHRLVWEDFEDFITGGPDGMDESVHPTIDMPASTGAAIGSLADHLGIPTGIADLEVSALPFRAYNLVYNEWYRDQDIVSPVALSLASGADTTTSTALLNAGWEKDYFTSARPFEAKGPSITIGIGGDAPVEFANDLPVSGIGIWGTNAFPTGTNRTVKETGDSSEVYGKYWDATTDTNIVVEGEGDGSGTTLPLVRVESGKISGVTADLSSAGAISINDLREALALQRYQEARARYGSRYTEFLRYLGIRSSDARLQRPEYLGGGKQVIQFSEVLQTAEGSDPLGTMGGHGISAVRTNRYRRYFEEHGYIVTMLTVRPKTIYMQGLFRTWNRRTKEDYWQKELQFIGQQEVKYKELYAGHATPDGTFGFQDRYDEYRRAESLVSGEFRGTTLDHWHMARNFESDPALNASFVTCTPTTRIFPAESVDTLYIAAKHSIQARRLLAQVGVSKTF